MNRWLRVYSWLAVVGAVGQVGFAAAAIFQPDVFGTMMATGRVVFSSVWLGNMGMLLIPLSLFMLATARDPVKFAPVAWLVVLEKTLASAYWLRLVLDPAYGKDFLPLLVVDGSLAVLPLVLLQLGLPPELRLSLGNLGRAAGAFRPVKMERGGLTWFQRVVWLGSVMNLGFILPALFAQGLIAKSIGAQYVDFSGIWLTMTGIVLLGVSLVYLPAVADPLRRPAAAWIVVSSRVVAAIFWFSIMRQPDRQVFTSFFISDGLFALVQLVLLQTGMPPELRISGANLKALLAEAWDALVLKGRPLPERGAAALVAVLLGLFGYNTWYYLMRAEPEASYATDEEHYKYGAIGLSMSSRVPYWLWKVMPVLCKDKLPFPEQGWASFGFIQEPNQDLPVGFARRELGYPSVEPNCALCHSGSYRVSASSPNGVLPAAPAHELDLEGFQRFLYDCAADPRFTASNVLAAIDKQKPMGTIESLYYRFAIIPMTQSGLLRQRGEYAWQKNRPKQGRGRTDTFNPTKIDVFFMGDDGTLGTTDLPQVWNQKPREKLWLHWDGNNGNIHERNFAAAMAIGATPDSVLLPSFNRVTQYLLNLAPPAYPFPINKDAAQRGQGLYEQNCAKCHSFQGQDVGGVTPVAEVGTDPHRLQSFTQSLVDNFHKIDMPPFKFDSYRKTQGYSNMPIDGIWARGPYLHNGSVPTLWDLLLPPEQRPTLFFRGYNVFDPERVGYVSQGPEAEAVGFRYDTSVVGNANSGHLYGTQLSEQDRKDLLEYLKML